MHDLQPPSLFIDFPTADAQLTNATIDVGGRVGDMLSGFMGLTVTVNGVAATVSVGTGNNGTFITPNVPLSLGLNSIQAIARDALGNQTTRAINVTRVDIAPGSPSMSATGGNGQSAPVGVEIADPLIVHVLQGDGVTPFVGKVVTFTVTRSNGGLASVSGGAGGLMLQVLTDSNGDATAYWTLGGDAGFGNNRVEVTSNDIAGTVFFCASALPGPASQINVGSGNNQRGEAGTNAPAPFSAWVSDACNPIANFPVTFTVTSGGGKVNGLDQVTINTSITGHADVQFTLGPDTGNNVVEANFQGNSNAPATFVAYGLLRDPAVPTSFQGLVLDNASQPLGGVICTLEIGNSPPLTTSTDVQGQFVFADLAGAGSSELTIDGPTATTVGGQPVAPGSFPGLHFQQVIVPNAVNSRPMPVLLPRLNPTVAFYSTTQQTILTCNGIEGLRMIVEPNSMTLANGQLALDGQPMSLRARSITTTCPCRCPTASQRPSPGPSNPAAPPSIPRCASNTPT